MQDNHLSKVIIYTYIAFLILLQPGLDQFAHCLFSGIRWSFFLKAVIMLVVLTQMFLLVISLKVKVCSSPTPLKGYKAWAVGENFLEAVRGSEAGSEHIAYMMEHLVIGSLLPSLHFLLE